MLGYIVGNLEKTLNILSTKWLTTYTLPPKKTKGQKIVRLYLLALFKYVPFGIVGYDFDYDFCLCLCGEIDSTK